MRTSLAGDPPGIVTVGPIVRGPGIRTIDPLGSPLEAELLLEINAHRRSERCPPWRLSSRLASAARGHSESMSRHRFFSHTDPEGRTVADRVLAAGYGPFIAVGENMAMGTRTPTETLRLWLASPPHRAVLVDATMSEAGVGIAQDGHGRRYWTLNCARPVWE